MLENTVYKTMVHNNTLAFWEASLKRKLKLPLIWHVLEIIVKPKAISDFINMLFGTICRQDCDPVSQAVANHIKQSPFTKDSQVEVIYNGVDNTVYCQWMRLLFVKNLTLRKDALVIGMMVEVNAIKGQNDSLRSGRATFGKGE